MSTQHTIAVVGVGLIGGSVGLALKRRCGAEVQIVGIGRSRARLLQALRRGAVDRVTTEYRRGIPGADLVIVCTPVETIADQVARCAPFLKTNAVITDAGSVKAPVAAAVRALRQQHRTLTFVGSHPIAGSEQSGVTHARADLFDGAWCVVCRDPRTAPPAAERCVAAFWEKLGARVVRLSPVMHDRVLAATSHGPHLVSYALVRAIHRGRSLPRLAGGAYRDMTRIAASNPSLWSWICWLNRRYVTVELERMQRELNTLHTHMESREALEAYLSSAVPPKGWSLR